MDVELALAGVGCLVLACGHTAIGVVWVLPGLREDRVPRTPFGPPSMTVAMVRITWHIVTIFCLFLGGVLIALASVADADAKTLLLRGLAAMWLGAAVMVVAVSPRRLLRHPRSLLRLPVPVLWVVIAVACWRASR